MDASGVQGLAAIIDPYLHTNLTISASLIGLQSGAIIFVT